MIEVSPEQAFLLYLGAGVLAIIGIWVRHHLQAKKKEVVTFRAQSFCCEFCHSSYLDDPMKPLTRCPECQSLNKNIHSKKR
jgi:Zn finger protein HypA/HybF involved in hydrogenase expression